MFQAILHGKVRDNRANTDLNSDWRSLYQSEDFLTAAVFCRLTYLPPDVLWLIIRSAATVAPPIGLPERVGGLAVRKFWPRWSLTVSEENKQIKEPDVFLLFERLVLLVEAKVDDAHRQHPEQWAAEVAAYVQRDGFDEAVPVWLFAIGGMGDEVTEAAALKMSGEAGSILHEKYSHHDVPVLLAACSWRQFLAALIALRTRNHHATSEAYIIDDLIEILRFHGFRHSQWLAELGRIHDLYGGIEDRSLAIWRKTCPH
jgi:hypothetical protein